MRLVLAAVLLASAAHAQSPTDILARNAGYDMARQLLAQDGTFSYDRFRDGFERGLRGDSVEIAYALGLRAGLNLRADTTTHIDPEVFIGGVFAGYRGDPPPYTQGEIARATAAFQEELITRQLLQQAETIPEAQAMLTEVHANGAASALFLSKVERRPGVQKSASGVLYRVTMPGRGASPTSGDQVEIRYVGRLADGTEFDRSPAGETATFPVDAVVPGFSEMLRAMTPGESRTIWIPASLAYGIQGVPAPDGGSGGIPPNSALEFDVTLVRIVR